MSYLIINDTTGEVVQEEATLLLALKAMRELNEHEQRNGRPANYHYELKGGMDYDY